MHGRPSARRAVPIVSTTDGRTHGLRRSGAVTWVDGRHALVAHTTDAGADLVEILRSGAGRSDDAYLLRVAEELGDRERLLVLGPESFRVELERRYVALYGHPDRIRESSTTSESAGPELLARLESLTGH